MLQSLQIEAWGMVVPDGQEFTQAPLCRKRLPEQEVHVATDPEQDAQGAVQSTQITPCFSVVNGQVSKHSVP